MTLTRHPLNTGFEWPGPAAEIPRALSIEQLAQFDTHGFCILPGAISPETLRELTTAIDPIVAGEGDSVLTLDGGQTYVYEADRMTFARNLVVRSAVVRDFLLGPLFADLCHDLIGGPCRLYWDQAVYKQAERAKLFPWHQDNGYTFTEPQAYITCWLALSEATVDHGCPWVMPGLHRMGTLHHEDSPDGIAIPGLDEGNAVATPVKAGDMVIFSSLTPHKTGPNVTDQTRKALIAQYMADGARLVFSNAPDKPLDDPSLNPRVSGT